FLNGLPMSVFATSSIDALIHAIESYTSPKANSYTKMYSIKAISLILKGYQKIIEDPASRNQLNKDFLIASNYAGIAFSNAGCAAVHAMSYPLGAKYHIPHGESNYAIFTGVYRTYLKLKPKGAIEELNHLFATLLHCQEDVVYDEIENLLNHILKKKSLKEYGVTLEDIDDFTQTVMEKQGRLMKNNYIKLDATQVKEIYKELYE
ncbi:MAG: iron-containing alcohol dehydrogenase, partial [Faecalibacillus sp.]